MNKSLSKEIFARYRSMQHGVNRGGDHDTYGQVTFKLHGIVKLQVSSSHDTSWYRRTAIHRDIGDTGIATFGITILTEL